MFIGNLPMGNQETDSSFQRTQKHNNVNTSLGVNNVTVQLMMFYWEMN